MGRCSKDAARRNRRKRVERIRAWLASERDKPCVDCGAHLPPECMEFDHVRGEKSFKLSTSAAKDHSDDEIRAELAKCDVRCPNCHRLRHYEEGFEYDPRAPVTLGDQMMFDGGAAPIAAATSPRRT